MKIPIQNIYYLLSYAWNKLDEKDRVRVSVDDKTQLHDLLAKILVNATRILLKRGIDKYYVPHTEELAGVKGKVQVCDTLKQNLLYKQRTICTYDDFSANILLNRILFTTLFRLAGTKGLDKVLKQEIVNLLRKLQGIDLLEISKSHFKQVKLNRNNRFYGFLLNVCELVYDSTLPSEKPGTYLFSDFTRDEFKMNRLFEAFLRNFYRIEQAEFSIVRREIIKWKFDNTENEAMHYLPRMETDITLENADQKIIIDAKYYRETLTQRYEQEKIKSGNLYQLFSYLMNQRNGSRKNENARGILVYPTIDHDYNLSFGYEGHVIEIKTVNLNTRWDIIECRLKEIIGV